MKKLVSIALLALLLSPLGAAAFGYSLSPLGAAYPTGAYGGLSVAAVFSPAEDLHAGDIWLGVDLAPTSPFFEGVFLRVSSPVAWILNHPFKFIFNNTVLWTPRLDVAASYRLGNEWSILIGATPFAFQDKHFTYDFLSPFAIYSITTQSWGWGMYIMRFAYFF